MFLNFEAAVLRNYPRQCARTEGLFPADARPALKKSFLFALRCCPTGWLGWWFGWVVIGGASDLSHFQLADSTRMGHLPLRRNAV